MGVDLVEKCSELSPTRSNSFVLRFHFGVECELA